MESKDASADTAVENSAPVEVKENDHNDTSAVEEPSPKKTKVEESPTIEKKQRRSSGRRNRCDIDIMEEAKAAYGDLDASEGRRLRKRAEPPKVEKPTPPPPKRKSAGTPGRKKASKEEPKEEVDNGEKNDESKTEKPSAAETAVEQDGVDGEKEEKKEQPQETPAVEADKKPVESVAEVAVEPPTDAVPDAETPTAESDPKSTELVTNVESKKDSSE